jgi:hypothetical protein
MDVFMSARGTAPCIAAVSSPAKAKQAGLTHVFATPLYVVPETVAVEVPAVNDRKSVMVNDRVLLLDPVSRRTGGGVGRLRSSATGG